MSGIMLMVMGREPGLFQFTISSNQTNANLRTLAVNAGWNQSSPVNATVASGVYVYSTSTGTPGLTIDGSWPGGVTLTNSGFIMGMGGNGGPISNAGLSGGVAISLGVNCSIVNDNYIGGGGGGGGGSLTCSGGGGAGGAAGAGSGSYTGGGAGGGPGSSGSNGGYYTDKYGNRYGHGGGGGRIMPGTGGGGGIRPLDPGGRGGGSGGGGGSDSAFGSNGGAGGSAGSAGASGSYPAAAGGGGWGAAGGSASGAGGAAGGAGGKAINLNGYTATRTGSGTTYGTVS